ncbi:hypothetical protein BDZ89DRAFT_955368 [Hymenopellis radicata]|nr:hypothetical protein BDZ89DRAFT_955368 [Hymenopellis radicata]
MSLLKLGCRDEESQGESGESGPVDSLRAHHRFLQRGYIDKVTRCTGKIQFSHDFEGKPLLHCEHYKATSTRSHYVQYIDEGFYDVDYLEAYFSGDIEETRLIELAAADNGYGPLASCTTITNMSSRRRHCPFPHRHKDGSFKQPLMARQCCNVKFRLFEPLEEYQECCPYVFVSFSGEHTHPPPLPLNTPRRIRRDIFDILYSIGEDLVDLTPRRLLRNTVLCRYISSHCGDLPNATLGDVHVSLANRAHLAMYIRQAKARVYPHGSGWKGALHMYKIEPEIYPVEARYIRNIIEFSLNGAPIKIIVCMTPDASRRFKNAQRIQCDTSYKRIVGFRELVIGHWDRDSHISLVFCRMYINSETAEAHEAGFVEVDRLIELDTGSGLKWRHLDAKSLTDFVGTILGITGDQGGGQSKGIGLYLVKAARKRALKYDLSEPHRLIQELGPYEHLHRIYRLCRTHAKRNIRESSVPQSVRNDMRSLLCVRHENWDATIARICEVGGRLEDSSFITLSLIVALDWVFNKQASGFAFEAMCWEKSKIPLEVWLSGDRDDNLIESSHFDVNQDGRHCSLVAGLEKGRRFDSMKMQSIKVTFLYRLHAHKLICVAGHRAMERKAIIQEWQRSGKPRTVPQTSP